MKWVRCNKIHYKLTTQSAPHQNHHNHKHPEEGQKYLIHNINHRLSIPKPRNFQYISLLDGFSWELISLSQPSHQDPSWKWSSHPKIEEKNNKKKVKWLLRKIILSPCDFLVENQPLLTSHLSFDNHVLYIHIAHPERTYQICTKMLLFSG